MSERTSSSTLHEERDMKKFSDLEIISFLEILDRVKPSNKAGEILQSIPMKKLCELEYGVSQWFYVGWLVLHLLLMWCATYVISNLSSFCSLGTSIFGIAIVIFMAIYSLIITFVHVALITARKRQMKEYLKMLKKIGGLRDHENYRWNKSLQIKCFQMIDLLFKDATFFMEYMWSVFIVGVSIMASEEARYAYVNPACVPFTNFVMIFGWLVVLVPLTTFSSIYKLFSVLEYIVINIMIPWIIIYYVVSIGFASAIQVEFKQLPNNSTKCIDGQPELSGFLTYINEALLELLAMTSDLDTELKNIRSIYCLLKDNTESDSQISLLIITYALISGLILLNMLIAIMCNEVTEAQQDKGWRQYRVSQAFDLFRG